MGVESDANMPRVAAATPLAPLVSVDDPPSPSSR